MKLKFGSDPEFFAMYKLGEKEYCVPPIYFRKYLGVNPIDESNPKHPIFVKTKDGVIIHQDGVAFEFTVPPVEKASKLKFYIEQGLNELLNLVNKFGYDIYCKPTVNFDVKRFFEKEDKEFKDCVIFGCDPDSDAFDYTNYKSLTINVEKHPYRYGGGHFHISGDELIKEFPIPAVRLLALTVGNLCVSQSLFPELDKLRSFHYGKPGKFRVQNYPDGSTGIEYRTPSNSWLTLEVEKMERMFSMAEKAINLLHNPPKAKSLLEEFTDQTINSIVNADKEMSDKILNVMETV